MKRTTKKTIAWCLILSLFAGIFGGNINFSVAEAGRYQAVTVDSAGSFENYLKETTYTYLPAGKEGDGFSSVVLVDARGNQVAKGQETFGTNETVTQYKAESAERQSEVQEGYPSSYDLRNLDGRSYVSSVKNQKREGYCWAFAADAAMESAVLKMKGGFDKIPDYLKSEYTDELGTTYEELNFSPYYLAWSFFREQGTGDSHGKGLLGTEGANIFEVINALSLSNGTNLWKNAPYDQRGYGISEEQENCNYYQIDNIKMHHKGTASSADRMKIKKWLMETGAVALSMYSDSSLYQQGLNGSVYYQSDVSYCNHMVTIVGWDDTFSRLRFEGNRPPADGAWLVKNSYGADMLDAGYFWLSYYDTGISEAMTIELSENLKKENIYAYDEAGTLSYVRSGIGANVFTVKEDEILQSIGYTVLEAATPKRLCAEIYILKEDARTPEDGELVTTAELFIEQEGYYEIPVETRFMLQAGEKIAVVLWEENLDKTAGHLSIEQTIPQYGYTYQSAKGQSYLYYDKEWHDIYELNVESQENKSFHNLAIRMITEPVNTSARQEEMALERQLESAAKILEQGQGKHVDSAWQEFVMHYDNAKALLQMQGIPATHIKNASKVLASAMDVLTHDIYKIATVSDWNRLSRQMKSGELLTRKIVLTKDITFHEKDEFVTDENGTITGVKKGISSDKILGISTQTGTGIGLRVEFDGQGHTVRGFYCDNANGKQGASGGLFALLLDGGQIKDLTVADSYIRGGNLTGGLCGVFYPETESTSKDSEGTDKKQSLIENVTIENVAVDGKEIVGGILGYNSVGDEFKNCEVKDCIIKGNSYVGLFNGKSAQGFRQGTVFSNPLGEFQITLNSTENKAGISLAEACCHLDSVTSENVKVNKENGQYYFKIPKKEGVILTTDMTRSLSGCNISLEKRVVYGSNENKTKITITNPYNGKKLTKNAAYQVEYKNHPELGKVTVKIQGKGKYTGVVNRSYYVVPGAVTKAQVKTKKEGKILCFTPTQGAIGYEVLVKSKRADYRYYTIKEKADGTKKVRWTLPKQEAQFDFIQVRPYIFVGKKKVYGAWTSKIRP